MNIILMGPPGSGKSTQAKILAEKLKIPYIKTGEIYREFAKGDSEMAKMVRETIDNGDLVADEITFHVVDSHLAKLTTGFVLDGFPRTLVQAQRDLFHLDKVINIHLSNEEATKRLLDRAKIENRHDDVPEVIEHRLKVYHEQTEPILNYYKSRELLSDVDGHGTIEDVTERIFQVSNFK